MISVDDIIALDVPPLLTALSCSVICALLGNYLILRRQSLLGDSIAHSVLPGIVVAFLLFKSRDSYVMLLGASIAGILSMLLVDFLKQWGCLHPDTALGVVFSTFFALGVILIEQSGARSIDLDASCVLYGQLEALFWIPPEKLFSLSALSALPEEVLTSFVVLILTILTIYLFYKELLIATFDPSLGNSLGYSSTLIHYGLGFFVAIAVVISFKAVGSILVIAMLICPAATSRLLTDKLINQLISSGIIATVNCITGYLVATQGIKIIGYNIAVSAAGMMTVISGCTLTLTIFLAPRYGILGRKFRQHKLAVQITAEDMLGALVRAQESAESSSFALAPSPITEARLRHVSTNNFIGWCALRTLKKNDSILKDQNQTISLTPKGATKGRAVIRSHRLWEVYLYRLVGIRPDHVHSVAERLEHFTAKNIVNLLEQEGGKSVSDPHGKKIPQE